MAELPQWPNYDTNFWKMNPPLRSAADRDGDSRRLMADGTIEISSAAITRRIVITKRKWSSITQLPFGTRPVSKVELGAFAHA